MVVNLALREHYDIIISTFDICLLQLAQNFFACRSGRGRVPCC